MRTTVPNSRINRPANESTKCADSNLHGKRNDSCLSTVSSRISSESATPIEFTESPTLEIAIVGRVANSYSGLTRLRLPNLTG